MRKLTGICAVDGCDKPVRRKVWCMAHYKRWWRHGDATAGGIRNTGSVAERFWARVSKGDGCWEWQGSVGSHGYGQLSSSPPNKRMLTTHRLSWELHHGEVPDGLMVLHHCDNKQCVRPDHLYVGTHSDNLRDMWQRGQRYRGHVLPRHA
jgi:hypothetical protein